MFDEIRPVPKPKYRRGSKKRKERGKITPDTYQAVIERDGHRCVLCSKGVGQVWKLEAHHCKFRSQGGSGEIYNLALVCGPATQPGTCHWKAHNEKRTRQLLLDYVNRLYPQEWEGQDEKR